MKRIIMSLRLLAGRPLQSPPVATGTGQRIQAGEQEAARQRLLDQAQNLTDEPAPNSRPGDPVMPARIVDHGE